MKCLEFPFIIFLQSTCNDWTICEVVVDAGIESSISDAQISEQCTGEDVQVAVLAPFDVLPEHIFEQPVQLVLELPEQAWREVVSDVDELMSPYRFNSSRFGFPTVSIVWQSNGSPSLITRHSASPQALRCQ